MGWKVLVTARAFWVSGQTAEAQLAEAGCEVVRSPRPGPLPEDELIALLQDCDAVIGSSDPYTARVFAECPRLKVVARCGVGTDSVDMNAAAKAGVIATNTPGAMTEAVADFTFALMLSIARRIPEGDALMRVGGWSEFRGATVYGKTLGLVGVGRIGRAVAKRAHGFAMRVLAYDPAFSPSLVIEGEKGDGNLTFVTLEDLLAQSDYVSLHAPATSESAGMFDAARIAQMKPTAFLINTARGALINEADLLAALEAETIAGAALDVYSQEPLPAEHPLRKARNCVLTPHNAFNALESTQEMSRQSALPILQLLDGERPDNVCNPAVWDSPLYVFSEDFTMTSVQEVHSPPNTRQTSRSRNLIRQIIGAAMLLLAFVGWKSLSHRSESVTTSSAGDYFYGEYIIKMEEAPHSMADGHSYRRANHREIYLSGSPAGNAR